LKRILLTISGLKFHKDEGAKNRLDSFINSYSSNGFKVDVLLFFSLQSFRYLLVHRRFLNKSANWFLFPAIPLSRNILIAKLGLFINQLIFGALTRLKKYDFYQSEILGSVGKWRPSHGLYIIDFHGDSITETEFRYKSNNKQLENLLLFDQLSGILNSSHVITVSEELKNQLEKNTNLKIANYSIISCGVDIQRFENPSIVSLTDNRKIVLGYLGGLQKWQNIDKVLDIVISLRSYNSDIFFALFTNDLTTEIVDKLNVIGHENYLIKSLKFSEVPDYLYSLDAGFLIRENLPLNIVSSPTKTVEYLASGVPVICTQYSGDFRRSINHLFEGFILKDIFPTESEIIDLNNYLINLKKNRELFRDICRLSASKRTWGAEFSNFFKNVVSNKEVKSDV
jgi:glycosyltransferase involved in cell wall biosynthesis